MPRPGTTVTLRETPSPVSLPTDTGVAFIAGLSDTGPLTAKLIRSIAEFTTVFGARQSYSVLYDAVECFFREGGNTAYLSRVVGPGATSGVRNLLDASAGTSLVVTAIGPGAWSANYKAAVVAGVGAGTFKVQITTSGGTVLEDSGDLLTQQAAAQWSQNSNYVRITVGGSSLNPAVAAGAALSAGTDDRGSITDAQWLAALNMFTNDLGPGQVLAPGRTSTAGQQQLITHAEANNRVAIIDLVDTPTEATLEGATSALTSSRFAASFSPWLIVPGVTTSPGTTRTVPPSGSVAGIIARNDPGLGTNRPSAGRAGILRFVTGLSQPAFTDTQRTALNTNSVNLIRNINGAIKIYGWRSNADPVNDSNWVDFANGRLHMEITAELNVVGENFVFEEIDGQDGETIGDFKTALAGVGMEHYNNRELFGDSADAAFSVDTGHSVNTLATIALNELHAVFSYKASAMAEWISIEVVKAQLTDSL